MLKINLVVLNDLVRKDMSEALYKEFLSTWIFDDFENYGVGCSGICSECSEDVLFDELLKMEIDF